MLRGCVRKRMSVWTSIIFKSKWCSAWGAAKSFVGARVVFALLQVRRCMFTTFATCSCLMLSRWWHCTGSRLKCYVVAVWIADGFDVSLTCVARLWVSLFDGSVHGIIRKDSGVFYVFQSEFNSDNPRSQSPSCAWLARKHGWMRFFTTCNLVDQFQNPSWQLVAPGTRGVVAYLTFLYRICKTFCLLEQDLHDINDGWPPLLF